MKALLLLIAVIGITACDEPRNYRKETYDAYVKDSVQEITLDDGTRCVVYVNHGISCDLRDSKPKE